MDDEKALLILREDADDMEHYEDVSGEMITGTSRWSTYYRQIWKDKRNDTFWMINWSRGSTEYQDEGFEHVSVLQVWPHKVETIQYFPVDPSKEEK